MSEPLARYSNLGIEDGMTRIHRYPTVCKELSSLLREAYDHLPKTVQSKIFHHTLAAFRLLPEMQTSRAVSAAQLLLQSAEAALPKQKKNLATAEFKHAMVAHKRHKSPCFQGESTPELPQDVLLHIFGYLDVQSLVSAGLVCRSWNFAANDNNLWQSKYALFHNSLKIKERWDSHLAKSKESALKQESMITSSIDWRDAFKRAYTGNSSKRYHYDRGYCIQCEAIVWLDNWKCSNRYCVVLTSGNKRIAPISLHQVVEYVLNDCWLISYLSDSDSDSDEDLGHKLWAYPKHIGRHRDKSLI